MRKTLAARGLEEHDVRVSLIFAITVSLLLFTCLLLLMYFISKNFWFTIHVDSWFWRIIDRICWACAIFGSIPNLQACTDRQRDRRTDRRTDGRTDELIRVELGNQRFLQVNTGITRWFIISKKLSSLQITLNSVEITISMTRANGYFVHKTLSRDPPTLIPFESWDSQLSACVITFWCHTGEFVN